MPSGLAALLDDVAAITKLAAASLDDVGAAAGKAGSKAMGVVVDDAAVTPRYVTGLTPDRELPIIWKIAMGSLRNKLLLLLPGALLLSWLVPWAITPLLMIGGAFLCFEGAEKVIEAFGGGGHGADEEAIGDPAHLEAAKVSGAIRTDLILSAEIMAIALNDVAAKPLWERGVVLALVGIGITVLVYGVVGLIVKMDDFGLHLARRPAQLAQAIGRGLVKGMPVVMRALSIIGTAAMIWVGGGILVHGAAQLGWHAPEQVIHHAAEAISHSGVITWIVTATGSGIVGLAVGTVIAFVIGKLFHGKTDAH
jgi:predicted DNA repair protein MutK